MFRFFKRRKHPESQTSQDEVQRHSELGSDYVFREFSQHDHLRQAAVAGQKAQKAIKEKQFDVPWRLLHEQKSHYLAHAGRQQFTVIQTLALDATVNEQMANILRMENKHEQALVHILYWVIAGSRHPIKRHTQKFAAYFRRGKFEHTSLEEAMNFATTHHEHPDYTLAQHAVAEWKSREQ